MDPIARYDPTAPRSPLPQTNPAKVKRAAAHPDRPGEKCQAPPGAWRPEIDRNRCEGKADCAEVCPHDVFSIERMTGADFARLSLLGKLKATAHGRKTAYTPHADACQACGLCVVACPEKAIRLAQRA
jgi:NAD-dependent dihydropyrimidine dehydrogenase PreA subunit